MESTNERIEFLSERKIIKLSNRLCLSGFNLKKELSLDILMILLTEINKEDETLPEFAFPFHLLEKKRGKTMRRKQDEELQQICEDLTGKNLKLYKSEEWINICDQCNFYKQDGVWFLHVVVNPALGKELLSLKQEFTTARLDSYLSFNSFQSKRMYLVLVSFSGMPHRKMKLEELHEILLTNKAYMERFDNFRSRVLNNTINKLNSFENEKAKISYTMDKQGTRRVKQLKFKMQHRVKIKSTKKKSMTKKEILQEKWRKALAGEMPIGGRTVKEIEKERRQKRDGDIIDAEIIGTFDVRGTGTC